MRTYVCKHCERVVDWNEEGLIQIEMTHPNWNTEEYKFCSYKCLRTVV